MPSLYHPIFELVDQEGLDRGGYFRLDYAGDLVEATFGGELRVGDIRAKRFVNRGGKRGALRVNADQHARAASLYGEVRVRPVAEQTLIAGGIYADGKRRQVMNFNAADPAQNGTVGRADFNAC